MRPILIALSVAALSLAACGKKEETPKPGVKVAPNGTVTITGRDGAVVQSGDKVNADLPDFAPLYPGAIATGQATSVASAEGRGGMFVYLAPAKPDQVLDFYREKAKAAGLTDTTDINMGAARMLSASDKTDKRAMQVIVTGEGRGSSVSLSWTRPDG